MNYERKRIIADLSTHAGERIDRVMTHGLSLLDSDLECQTFAFTVVIAMIESLGNMIGENNTRFQVLSDEEKGLVTAVLLRQFAAHRAGKFDAEQLAGIVRELHAEMMQGLIHARG